MALRQKRRFLVVAAALIATAAAQGEPLRQTFAPHEMKYGDAPAPIVWPTPPLPNRAIKLETAEERHVRVVVVTDELEQPWSMVFLPGGGMLVTERAGRIRLIRNGKLESRPVHGVPDVYTGGPRGLQGLMDIALHPTERMGISHLRQAVREWWLGSPCARYLERCRVGRRAGALRF